jgi:hypothetical protein
MRVRRTAWACLLGAAVVALAAACGKGTSSSAAPAGAGDDSGATGDDGGDGARPEKPRAPSALALRDIVGVSSHPMLGSDPTSTAERAFEWSKLAELGIHRMRTDFTWSAIEPQRGAFAWADYDALVAEASAHGVDLLPVLDYGVPWATSVPGADDHFPPDDPHDFGTFAAAAAGRYQASITDYEVWNEPNNGLSFWKPTASGDPAAYGALLLAANTALLAAQPGAHVAYGGTVYDDLVRGPDFVAQSFADTPGLAGALGAFAMHAYMIYPPFRGPESIVGGETPLLDKIAIMSAVLDSAGAKPVPIWITEIGWPTMTYDPPDQQARYTVRAIVLAALGGADRLFLYTLRDGPHPEAYPPEDAFGMVGYSDFSADGGVPADKPVFVAVKAVMGAVGSFGASKRLPAQPDDVYLVELANAGQTAWIAWRSTDGAAPVPVTVPASGNVRVTHVDGSTVDATADAAGYAVQVGPDPIVVAPR